MIFVASQRGGGHQLAAHLLNTQDNEQVEVAEVTGTLSDDLKQAFDEFHAVSKGTQCTQYLFSVSLSPPPKAKVSHEVFQDVLARIEKKMGLEGQARALVYHTKENRRHLHAVWSRIDPEKMTAVNLPFFKDRLMQISKDIYLEQGWELPKGLIDRHHRNPLNFSRAEWEQAKRIGNDPRIIKATLKQCWQQSEDKLGFESALQKQGYRLAKGDRRGYVAVDWQGEVFSLSRATGAKTKALAERLGQTSDLPSVEQAKTQIDQALQKQIQGFIQQIDQKYKTRAHSLERVKARTLERHTHQRELLLEKQATRWQQEHEQRQARFNQGVRGLWQRLTGTYKNIQQQNEWQAYQAHKRDQQERDDLIYRHLDANQTLQEDLDQLQQDKLQDIDHLKTSVFTHLSQEGQTHLKPDFDIAVEAANDDLEQEPDMDMSM